MIIGICGHKGSGKDYLANILKEYTGFKVVHFADPIKDIISDLFKISKDELNELKNSEDTKILGTNMRSILQTFGTNIMQKFCGKRIWVDLVLKEDNLIIFGYTKRDALLEIFFLYLKILNISCIVTSISPTWKYPLLFRLTVS